MDINLLPWREEIIAHNKKILMQLLLSALVLSGVFLIFIYYLFFEQLTYTKSYTQTLEKAKANLVGSVAGFLNTKKIEKEIGVRFVTLQQLQYSRFDTIRLLNEFTHVTPKGIYLTTLTRNGNQVQLSGTTNSNLLISQMMKAIEASKVMQVGSLQKVEKTEGQALTVTQFDLHLTLTSMTGLSGDIGKPADTKEMGNVFESLQKNREEQSKLIDAAVKQ